MMGRVFVRILLLVALAASPIFLPPFYVTLFNYIGLYALVTLGLVLLTGTAGLTSLGQAAFVGIGAYTTAMLSTSQMPELSAWTAFLPWAGLVMGLLITLVASLLIGAITLRWAGHFLTLGTIAWGLSLYYLFGAAPMFEGHTGITNIPAISFFGWQLERGEDMFWLIWAVLLLMLWALRNLLDSREGRAIRALKGGRLMAEAMGIETARSRMMAFVIAALLASVAGWLYAHLQRFVNPSPFGLTMSIEYLFMAVVGGAGYLWGAVVGAGVITILKEWLQELLPRLLGTAGNFEMIAFALLMVLVLQRAPEGLWSLSLSWLARRKAPNTPSPLKVAPPPLECKPMPTRGEVVLQVNKVTRRFGGLTANRDMSLELRAGEILAVIGPNGAGKSTLFNQISGVDTPTSGEVLFRGVPVAKNGSRGIAKQGLSRTFQHVRLLPLMSVLHNVALGAHLRGKCGPFAAMLGLDHREEAQLRAEASHRLADVGLADRAGMNAGSLALGQQRLLEIARSLASDPCVLLLDEPAAGLRYQEKQDLASLLAKLKERGMGILLVEHDMEFVMSLSDRIVVMNFGEKIAEGLPQEVRCHPAVLEAYLGGTEA